MYYLIKPPVLVILPACLVNAPTVVMSKTPVRFNESFCAHIRCKCKFTGINSKDSSVFIEDLLKEGPK